jgi:cellulose synthase/poly-beta-1,6-N-acetylglucosamine synthase-like glycosyltransferase
MKSKPEFSIILPQCHNVSFLRVSLKSLCQINFPSDKFEVLVIGGDDDDESREIVENEACTVEYDLKYIGSNSSKRSRRLNAACAIVRGSVLVFSDDDCIFLPNWLKKLNEVLQLESNIGIVGGKDELQHNGSAFDMALDCVLNSFLGTGGMRSGDGRSIGKYYPKLWNMAIPRDVASSVTLEAKGGFPQVFNEALIVHEDVDLAKRIKKSGRRIVFAPEVRVKHYRDTTFYSTVRRNFNMAHTCRLIGVHRFPHMILSIFVLSALVLTISSIFFQPLRIVFLICVGTYMTLLFVSTIGGLKQTRRLRVLLLIPVLTFSLHVSRGLGFFLPCKRSGRMETGL